MNKIKARVKCVFISKLVLKLNETFDLRNKFVYIFTKQVYVKIINVQRE